MLVTHVVVAFTSLIIASLAAYTPTKQKLLLTYVATAGTLVSGALLMVLETVSVARVCVSGGVYLVALAALILIIRKKLAATPLY
jgi:hypothetical protein